MSGSPTCFQYELLGDVPEKRLNVVALENGCTLAVEVGPLPPSPEGLFAVMLADEIELVPDRHQGTGIDEGSGLPMAIPSWRVL